MRPHFSRNWRYNKPVSTTYYALMSEKTLFLLDGSSYLYRAYHAMPPLTNRQGQATGAVYGLLNMLRRLLHDFAPVDYIAVIFDAKGKTFRHALYPPYKAQRPAMPADLASQIPLVHQLVQALGLPLLSMGDVEADDVLATLAVRAEHAGMHTLLFTSDKDLAQLVSDHIHWVNPTNNAVLGVTNVVEKFGVQPAQIVDYLSLIGDKVDNIHGVDGVGAKTAAKWLQQYGSLDNLLRQVAEIKGKVGENLRTAQSHLPLNRQLITLKTDVLLPHQPWELRRQAQDIIQLRDLYQQLEFKTGLEELNPLPPVVHRHYPLILTAQHWDDWLAALHHAPLFALDTETTALNYRQARLVGLSFALADKAAYLPLAHDYKGVPQQLDFTDTLAQLKPILENPQIKKVGQHLKYDSHVLAHHGIKLQGIEFDTLLEAGVLDSQGRHDLDSLALRYLNHTTTTYEDIAGKGQKQRTFNQIELQTAGDYAAEDAAVCWQLHQHLWAKIQQHIDNKKVLCEIELPLLPVLTRMEAVGVQVDVGRLGQLSQQWLSQCQRLEQQAFDLAGKNFNLSSPKQLQQILFEKLALPVVKKTPKGQPSTAEAVLQQWANDHELPRCIMQYRHLSKLKSTYTDTLPQQIDPQTGRIHTHYQQLGAATGRLSSSNPNLQNIPIRTAEGRKIRQAFTAPSGYKILAADYSQIELRIMAHLSKDGQLRRAFEAGDDIHRATAAEVFDCPKTEVSHEQRRHAKAINFGLIYGMSAHGLSRRVGVERRVAQAYIDKYFQRYPQVKQYMDHTRAMAKQHGYVQTVFGRRLYLPDINSRNSQRQQYAERAAINAPMQGTAADIIKYAMIKIDQWIQNDCPQINMVMQVHDELVFEVPEAQLDHAKGQIKTLMENIQGLDVNLQVDIGTGDNWDEAH
jgi:DNA polymerase-1